MRKLIVCMDGTGNEIGDGETNIVKFYRGFTQDENQLTFYVMGVGTNDGNSVNIRPSQKFFGVLGLAFGYGLEDDVLRGYRWLCKTYRGPEFYSKAWEKEHEDLPDDDPRKDSRGIEGDQIYVTGFSRGAYAARVLAGFIHDFGLVAPDQLHLVAPAFRAYRSLTKRDDENETASVRFRALRQFDRVLRPTIAPIRALLLFDTVASIIRLDWPWYTIPQNWSLAVVGKHALHRSTAANGSVRIVTHAMAVDERRSFFRNLNWTDNPAYRVYYGNRFKRGPERMQYVDQRWFPGYHSDIGGGYAENESGIGKITALWILDRLTQREEEADAEDLKILNAARVADGKPEVTAVPGHRPAPGLRFTGNRREVYLEGKVFNNKPGVNAAKIPYSEPDHCAPIHNSIFTDGAKPRASWVWLILELLPPKWVGRRDQKPPAWFRRLNPFYLPLLEPRQIPQSHQIDDSVYLRKADPDCGYDPENVTRDPVGEAQDWWINGWLNQPNPDAPNQAKGD
ncbi:hypothetical protein AIOL_002413 [Candidatus Rhodobacter oscarellae]|uniref:T6SS Phospholipase effector Tle1-like catalytic domain-containing protein n=1 Tax=Candidatus Rhodobacter oscarellae TaxID=1675527 RepID=A0A0J9E6J9_9RHOB|nr:DUF2235 domain-containing protein [Candidatus Rhodobacter lobularis]KMW57449.1 hypothetical protein AIOL_002413 [Candidatus Rhodobacter lobularis]